MLLDSQEFNNLIHERIIKQFSTKEIENFFGITIKKAGYINKSPIYNVYDSEGTLLLAETYALDIQNSFNFIMNRILEELFSNAKDDNEEAKKEAQKAVKDLKKKKQEEEIEKKKDWVKCPHCGELHPKGLHFHLN